MFARSLKIVPYCKFPIMIGRFEKFWCKIFFLAALLGIVSCSTSVRDHTPRTLAKEISFLAANGPVEFSIEIADTVAKRAQGLSGRESLAPNHGMLFVFERANRHPFWMKNTALSLDIIFFDDQFKVVGIIENAEPFSEKLMHIDQDARYALEVLAGTVKKHGINLHTTARLSYE